MFKRDTEMQPDGSFSNGRPRYKKAGFRSRAERELFTGEIRRLERWQVPCLVSWPKRLPGHRWTGAYCRKPKKVKSEKNGEWPLVFLYRFPVFMTFPSDAATIAFMSGRCDSFGERAFATAKNFAFRDFHFLMSSAIIVLIRMLSGRDIKACGHFELFRSYPDRMRKSEPELSPDRITRWLAG